MTRVVRPATLQNQIPSLQATDFGSTRETADNRALYQKHRALTLGPGRVTLITFFEGTTAKKILRTRNFPQRHEHAGFALA